MNEIDQSDWGAYTDVVQANIDGFIDELRSIDIVDLISYIRMEQFPNIEDLVNSSTELFFRAEMLVFGWAAGVDLRWDGYPMVTLGMEFRHPSVSLFFNLSIGATERLVEILGVAFEEIWIDPVAHLRSAFADARLQEGARDPVAEPARVGRRSTGRWSPR